MATVKTSLLIGYLTVTLIVAIASDFQNAEKFFSAFLGALGGGGTLIWLWGRQEIHLRALVTSIPLAGVFGFISLGIAVHFAIEETTLRQVLAMVAGMLSTAITEEVHRRGIRRILVSLLEGLAEWLKR